MEEQDGERRPRGAAAASLHRRRAGGAALSPQIQRGAAAWPGSPSCGGGGDRRLGVPPGSGFPHLRLRAGVGAPGSPRVGAGWAVCGGQLGHAEGLFPQS